MPKITWKIGAKKHRKETKGEDSVQKTVKRDKAARKGNKERGEAVLVMRSSVK